jgi:hypothetical protein
MEKEHSAGEEAAAKNSHQPSVRSVATNPGMLIFRLHRWLRELLKWNVEPWSADGLIANTTSGIIPVGLWIMANSHCRKTS